MPNLRQNSASAVAALFAELIKKQEVVSRARVYASFAVDLIPNSAVTVYTLVSDGTDTYWISRATVGDAAIHDQTILAEVGTLGQLLRSGEPIRKSHLQLKREDYPHVDARRTVRSLDYVPLSNGDDLIGALEVLCFEDEPTGEMIETLVSISGAVGASLVAAEVYETERQNTLSSITRLTQLYDLEKVFSSTLEMELLLPLVTTKFREILGCEAVNIWLLHPDESLELMHQAGHDPTAFKGQVVKSGEGVIGELSNTGEAVCIADELDPRLVERNRQEGEDRVRTLIAVAIMDRESLVGCVEAINKEEGATFNDDDLFVLSSLADTASNALHNAGLLMAERKVEILETLNNVSHEITSTLNLERMLQTIVNAPQAVIPYERAAIALEYHGRFKLSAVSGVTQVHTDAPDIAPLNDLLQWASLSEEIIHVRQRGDEIDSNREETVAKFRNYFAQSGMRGFYAMPLNDDTGRVGMLALESSDPDFLGPAHVEILQLLSSQATVALRNAQMYKEVPFISMIEPVLVRKRRFMAMEKRRRALIVGSCAVALLFLVAFPFPLRVDGDAVVTPLYRVQIQPETPGVVYKVLVHEGDRVQAGDVIAEMENWDSRYGLAEAQAKHESALMQMNHALAVNDGSAAGAQQVQADYWQAELSRAQQVLDKSKLRSPIDGFVATPHVDSFAGRKLALGDSFAEVVDTSRVIVDVAIDDEDAGLLRNGQNASVKLNSYPARTFRGQVVMVSQQAENLRESPVFYSRVAIENPDGAIRAGMEGRGKVKVGTYPAGYVLLRHPYVWIVSKFWSWLGW
ncbi:MAG: efflux RND transporter periplasmic adaptor subunit [Candidatus Acidiferrum sp.]